MVLYLFWTGAALPQAPSSVAVESPPVILVDNAGSGTGTLLLRYMGTPGKLRLDVTEFRRGDPGKGYTMRTTSVLAAVNPAQKSIVDGLTDMPAGDLPLKVTVAGLMEAGVSRASFRNNQKEIVTITAVRVPAAYNVQLESVGGGTPEVMVSPNRKPSVRLLNTDSSPYRFAWQVRINGEEKPAAERFVEIPANGSATLDLSEGLGLGAASHRGFWDSVTSAPSQWLVAGTLKDNMTAAELILKPVFEGAMVPLQPPKVLPLRVRERFWSDGMQEAMNLAFLFLLLCVGGIVSIWVNCGMPNTTRALALRRRLKTAKAKIEGLGEDIGSRWRVMLFAYRDRLKDRLYGTWWVFPSYATVLDFLDKDVATFETWVQRAYDVALIAQEAKPHRSSVPPTVVQSIKEECRKALQPMETGFTVDEEAQVMLTSAREARRLLAAAIARQPMPELEAAIAEREQRIAADQILLSQSLPAEFHPLINEVAAAGQPVKPVEYFARDFASRKLEILREYCHLERRMGAAQMGQVVGGQAPAPLPGPRARLQQPAADLLDNLRLESVDALERAERLLLQIKQNVYTADLRAELVKQPPAASIGHTPSRIETRRPARFTLRFDRRDLSVAGGCGLHCLWEFGDGEILDEDCEVHHAFSRPGDYTVTASITDENGSRVASLTTNLTVTPEQPSAGGSGAFAKLWRWFAPETMLEASRLLLVLAIAVVGLFAAAQQQIQNLTFLQAVGAAFALGFGAGTLKNLITERAPAETK